MPSSRKSRGTSIEKNNYWDSYLQGLPSAEKLFLDGFNTTVNNLPDSYAIKKIALKKTAQKKMGDFSKKFNLPLNAILNCAWGLLLCRLSGSEDTVYGISYNNILAPVKINIHSNKSILDFAREINQQLVSHVKNISSLKAESDESIFIYVLLNEDKTHKFIKNTSITPIKHPLVLLFNNKNSFTVRYNKNHFNDDSAKVIADHFEHILNKITIDYEQTCTHFSILTKKESIQLLQKWNVTKKPIITLCTHELLAAIAKDTPDKTAICYKETQMSYKILDEKSNQLANMLRTKGIKSGDVVAVLMERTPAIIIAMIATWKAGAIYVPINPKYPDERIHFILNDCDPAMIMTDSSDRISREYSEKMTRVDNNFQFLKKYNKKCPENVASSKQVAYIVYTSGTTGQPKGVMIQHGCLNNLNTWYRNSFGLTANDRVSQFASQGFDTFFCETVPTLALGASVHIIDDHTKLTPSLFLNWLIDEKITICDLPTSYSQILFNIEWPASNFLRLLKVGGECLINYPKKIFSYDIWNGYGPTEATVEATFCKIYQANISPESQPQQYLPPPIGKPIDNCEAYVVDNHLQPVATGSIGELLLGGKNISCGYFNRPQLTREKFISHMFSDDKNAKLYRTGDLVRWLPDGNLEFIGRVDHQVKIRGYRIELSEIETVISQHPDVSEVVVLAKEVSQGQKSVIAYLVANLDKIRIPYQERCLFTVTEDHYQQAISEDISKQGAAISGVTESLAIGKSIKINLKLPGAAENQWLTGAVVWQQESRAGIKFDDTQHQKALLQKSIEYYLSKHNLMETLKSAAAKRSLKKALSKKLPDYMIPSYFTILPSFPLTFNGKIDTKTLPPPQDFERLLERKYVAPRTETEVEIANIWSEILNHQQVSITDNFFDLGGNSLLISTLSIRILQKFSISIPVKILFDLPFIPAIAEFIDSKGQHHSYTSLIAEEIKRDAILQDNLNPLGKLCQHIEKPQGILLTGAAGFLGIYLLRELLAHTSGKIFCLIRKGEFESVANKLILNIEKFELSKEITLSDRRIIIIGGDIALDQFGLPVEQYNHLLEKVDVIYHCGAQVNTMAPYQLLRNSNVQGTMEIIKFAIKKHDKPIHYVSTLSAACKKNHEGHFVEDFPDADSEGLISGYALSKWVSERLLLQIKNRGLPVTIYRSGYILGQSDTGVSNTNDALLLLIKGCIQLGFAPRWKEKVTILPVDFVSEAIVKISQHKPTASGVYHLDHPQGIMWTDLVSWLNTYGYPIKLCAHQHWLELLMQIDKENALYPFLPHYLSQVEEPNTPPTSMIQAESILQALQRSYPEMSDALLTRYFHYLRHIEFLPHPHETPSIKIT